MSRVLKPPSTHEGWKTVAAQFRSKWNFPMCISAEDWKHIMIDAVVGARSKYYTGLRRSIVLSEMFPFCVAADAAFTW